MAKFDGKYLRGLLGPFIFKKTKKGVVVSTKAKKVRQTEATKKSATFFGEVASFARVLRETLKPIGYPDTGFMNRLNKELLSILRQCYDKKTNTFDFSNTYFSRLEGMNFNTNSPLTESLLTLPSYHRQENQLTISIPDITASESLKFPVDALLCELCIQSIQIDLNGGNVRKIKPRILIEIEWRDDLVHAQEFTIDLFPGTLCIVAIGLNFFTTKNNRYVELNNIDFSPSAFTYANFSKGVFTETLQEPYKIESEDGSTTGGINAFWLDVHRGFPISKLPVE